MMRVLLIVVATILGLWGLQSALAGLYLVFAAGGRGLLAGLLQLALGTALLSGCGLIVRSQMCNGEGGDDVDARRRQLRAGLRILLTILAVLVGLGGLLLSLCGVLFGSALGKDATGWFVAIGVVLVAVAILLVVKAGKMR